MTKKELKEMELNTIKDLVSTYIKDDVKNLNVKNKKLYKDMVANDLKSVIACLSLIKDGYYAWEINVKDDNTNSNFDRLIYLFNQYYSENILTHDSNNDIIESDETINIKSNHRTLDYRVLAEEVGL